MGTPETQNGGTVNIQRHGGTARINVFINNMLLLFFCHVKCFSGLIAVLFPSEPAKNVPVC